MFKRFVYTFVFVQNKKVEFDFFPAVPPSPLSFSLCRVLLAVCPHMYVYILVPFKPGLLGSK